MELYPGFSLYRGLYELSQSAFSGDYRGIDGMRWRDFENGMKEVTCIMLIEWLLLLVLAYYIDQITYSGKHPLFFLLKSSSKKKQHHFCQSQTSKVVIEMEKSDVCQEVKKETRSTSGSVLTRLNKIFMHFCLVSEGESRASSTRINWRLRGFMQQPQEGVLG